MKSPLTPEQLDKQMAQINGFLSQYFDGYSLVGFHALTGQPISFRSATDSKTAFALNGLLQNAACSPIQIPEPPEDDKAHF